MWAQPAPDPRHVGHCCHHTNRVPWGTSGAFFKVSSKPFAWGLALLQALEARPSPPDESKQWTPGPGSPGGRGESVCAAPSPCAAFQAMTPDPGAWGSQGKGMRVPVLREHWQLRSPGMHRSICHGHTRQRGLRGVPRSAFRLSPRLPPHHSLPTQQGAGDSHEGCSNV